MNYEPCQHLSPDQQAEIDKACDKERKKLVPVSKATALASLEVLISNYAIIPINEHWKNVERRIRGE